MRVKEEGHTVCTLGVHALGVCKYIRQEKATWETHWFQFTKSSVMRFLIEDKHSVLNTVLFISSTH